ncbi:MAG: ZPR1 zinc finger domain-containing protein [Nanoarchaeota archaeon]|nr:ZPR1 zinc finger domain-containing protein [Nanoarchaeota archaeon]
MQELKNQVCPVCHKKEMTLIEDVKEIPHFGNCFIMSMTCENCKYHTSDVEVENNKGPCQITFVAKGDKDMKVRVVKSGQAEVSVPTLRMKVSSGPGSVGYVSNVEGVLKRFKGVIENERDNAEDPDTRKAAKNLLKKLWKVECGDAEVKIVIKDPTGNSVILSDKAEVKKVRG